MYSQSGDGWIFLFDRIVFEPAATIAVKKNDFSPLPPPLPCSVRHQIELNRDGFCLTTPSGWNMSTLFGLLLNYPVVYYYSDIVCGNNCLAQVDLKCIQSALQAGVDRKVTLFSFSFPLCLQDLLSDAVHDWTRKKHQDLWTGFDIQSEIKIVNLDVVLL
jgi:hypothetical protein